MGTLQNLMIKPYSIMQIISVKTLVWFLLNSVKACICIGIASLFIKLTFRFEYFYIVVLVCFGCMGISYILSALTLIFTKMASFVSIVGYLFLFLSGSILSLPGYLNYTNPLSAGSHFYALLIHQTEGVKDFFMLLILCAAYFFVGKEIFAFVFRRSKQFKWTY
jgi:ABC-2 type transporter